jgi:4-diphosphocytidyl-2-C-methyl-D-erythritol kinase
MSVTLSAYAKVNLTLEVLGKRSDGYHEIATVLQTISIADTLVMRDAELLELRCDTPGFRSDDNLVLKAARMFQGATGCRNGAAIHLVKRIPLTAGLGSGSTDAAAALIGLNRLWELNLPLERLEEVAASIGSDVPFFLHGGTAVARGRGEKVTPLAPVAQTWMVLLNPQLGAVKNKTAKMYALLEPSHHTSGQLTQEFADNCRSGGTLDPARLFNVFENVAFDFFAGLSSCRSHLAEAGAECVHLAGAGPALFAPVPDRRVGQAVLNKLETDGHEAYLVRTVSAEPPPSGCDCPC